jgi:hypothetical protein
MKRVKVSKELIMGILAVIIVVSIGYVVYSIVISGTQETGYDSGYAAGHEAGYSQGHDEGYQEGSLEGYSKGHSEGYYSGKDDGYTEGYETGEDYGYSTGYDAGYLSGIEEGTAEGFADGKEEGYEEGYAEGSASGEQAGYDEGYTVGYDEGYTEGSETAVAEKDPTYAEVVEFLYSDTTDSNQYVEPVYMYDHYARDLCNNAEKEGLRCAFVLLLYPLGEGWRSIVAFNTTDVGLVYFEPQLDARVEPVVGEKFHKCIVGYSTAEEPDYDDTIMDILIIW